MVELGVPETKIKVLGTGINNDFYETDIDEETGAFIEEIGKKNRLVVLTSADSVAAQNAYARME